MTDGYCIDDLIIFGGLNSSGHISKGFRLELPSLENGSDSFFNQLEDESRILLRSLPQSMGMQVRLSFDHDYSEELLAYYEDTQQSADSPYAKLVRDATFIRYSQPTGQDAARTAEPSPLFRKIRLHLFFSLPLHQVGGAAFRGKKDYEQLLQLSGRSFDDIGGRLSQFVRKIGGRFIPMGELDYFREFTRFFNPSATRLPEANLTLRYDPQVSILSNCLLGEPSPTTDPGGFVMDNHYHTLVAMKTLPRASFSGMMQQISSLPFSDYELTVNLSPLDQEKEIEQAEKRADKLRRALASHPGGRMKEGLERELAHIKRLASNETVPFAFDLIARTWAQDRASLMGQASAITAAISRLQGASPYIAALPTSARNYFEATLPGLPFTQPLPHRLDTEDHILSNLLPLTASPTADLENAEAIYPGNQGNLIGIRTFTDSGAKDWPKHALVAGKSGSGKSLLVENLLVQTTPFYEFTAIVDTGGSLEKVATSLDPGLEPLVVKPNGNVTFNYLSTGQAPLMPSHLSDVAATIAMMTGNSEDSEKGHYRLALVSEWLDEFYRDVYRDWKARNPDRWTEVVRHAASTRSQYTSNSAKFAKIDPEIACEGPVPPSGTLPTEDLDEFADDPENAELVYRLAFTFFENEEYPTHSSFHDWLTLEAMGERNSAGEMDRLASLLHPWRSDAGRYGNLLDGVGNLSLDRDFIYLELGQIPESAPALKSVVAFLLINAIRNEISRRPRTQRKRVVIEELNSFLTLPGGDSIVRDLFERSRKYSTWCLAVMQETRSLADARVASSVLGNVRMALLLKQTNPAESESLAHSFDLPEAASERLAHFPEPTGEHGATFLLVDNHHTPPLICEGRHVLLETEEFSGESASMNAFPLENNPS